MLYTKEIIEKKLNNKEKRRKALRIIIAPFVIAFIVLACYIAYQKYVLKNNNFGVLRLQAVWGSNGKYGA